MKYFNIRIINNEEGYAELFIPGVTYISGKLINSGAYDDNYEERGYFLTPDEEYIHHPNVSVNEFFYEIGFKSQKEVDKFCKKILGYSLGSFKFPESKTINDLYKLLEALEKYYDKNHRPIIKL